MSGCLLHHLKEIERWQVVGEIEDGVAHQHLVVEAATVIADHQIGPCEQIDELVGPLFWENLVGSRACAVGGPERDPHVGLFIPSSDVIGRTLGFQIEIDDVLRGRHETLMLSHQAKKLKRLKS